MTSLSKAQKTQIETVVNNQIIPLLNDKPVIDKWYSLMISGSLHSKMINRLFSGQPSDVLKALCGNPEVKGNKKNDTLLKAVSYLLSVEVDANQAIDLFILMMVAKGIDFHIEPDNNTKFIRHAASLEDLESVSVTLGAKLNFLKTCGLPCFEKYIDRTLRNKIAHVNFLIDDEGKFRIFENNKRRIVDIEQKLEMLQYFLSLIFTPLTDKILEYTNTKPNQ